MSLQIKPECKITQNTSHPNWTNPVDAAALGDIHRWVLPKAFPTFCIWESTCSKGTAGRALPTDWGSLLCSNPAGTLLSNWILLVLPLHFKGAFFPFSFGCSSAQKAPDWEGWLLSKVHKMKPPFVAQEKNQLGMTSPCAPKGDQQGPPGTAAEQPQTSQGVL